MEGADVDGDGFADVFPNSMGADGAANAFPNAGETTVTSGHVFSTGVVTLGTAPVNGTTATFNLVAEAGYTYVAAFSAAATPGIPIGAKTLFLAADPIFNLSLSAQPFFLNGLGVVGVDGRAQYAMAIPALPLLAGIELFTGFVTVDPMGPQIGTVSATTSFVIQ
jgi:hypothetical protein